MKKIFISLMCLIAIIFSMPIFVSAATNEGVLTLPEDDGTGYPVTGVNNRQYSGEDDIYKVIVPNNIVRLGEEVFRNCSNLSEIQLNPYIQMIGEDAFAGTAYYEDLNKWESGVLYIGDCLIKADPEVIGEKYEIRNGTRLIADGAFKDCGNLSTIIIPETIEYVGTNAFVGTAFFNNSLINWSNNSLILDYLLISVDDKCTGTFVIPYGIKTIADGAFSHSNVTEVTISNSVKHVGYNAFGDCQKLVKVSLGAKVETLGRRPFKSCTELSLIEVDTQNEHFTVVDGVLYNKELSHVVRCPQKTTGKVILPKSIKNINAYAFEDCAKLQNVEIPKGCVFIGNSAFSVCENLSDLVIPESMEYIDQYAFSYCNNIKSVVIPDSVYHLGSYAFYCCMNLKEIALGNGITDLTNGLFESCERLNFVSLGDSVTEISYSSFQDTKYISNMVNYKNGLLIASDKYLIKVADDVAECNIPYGITLIAEGAFEFLSEKGNLRIINIPHSLQSVCWDVFYDVPDNVSVHYDGTLYEFAHITDFDWNFINLYTTDFHLIIWTVVILVGFLIAFVISLLVYNRIHKKKQMKKENSYGHQ